MHRLHRSSLRLLAVWLGLMLLACLPPGAGATASRLAALGGSDLLEDDRLVTRWYGSLGDYANQVTLESGHFTLPTGWHDQRGGLVSGPALAAYLALDDAGRWGTVALVGGANADDTDPGSLVRDRLGSAWSAAWTRRCGAWQPAVSVRHAADSGAMALRAGTGAPRRAWDRTRTDLGLGLRWDMADGAYLDLAGEVRFHGEQTTVADTVLAVEGPHRSSAGSLGLRARSFVRLRQTTALVALVEYVREDRPLSTPSPLYGLDLEGDLFRVGAALNWYPDPDQFLFLSLDFLHGEAEHLLVPGGEPRRLDFAHAWDSVSLTLGFESRFRHWLTFRGSFRYEPVDRTEEPARTAADFATFMVNLGAMVHLGDYSLDLSLTDQEPRAVAGYWGHSLLDDDATWLSASLRRTF